MKIAGPKFMKLDETSLGLKLKLDENCPAQKET
jgi:hypothetical protein